MQCSIHLPKTMIIHNYLLHVSPILPNPTQRFHQKHQDQSKSIRVLSFQLRLKAQFPIASQAHRSSQSFMFLIHIKGGGGCITSQKSICIDGKRPTQASTSPYSVERLLRERLSLLEICLTHHVSTEEWLKRADMKPFSKEGKQHRWKMIGHNIL